MGLTVVDTLPTSLCSVSLSSWLANSLRGTLFEPYEEWTESGNFGDIYSRLVRQLHSSQTLSPFLRNPILPFCKAHVTLKM